MGDQELSHGILNSGLALALDNSGQMHMIFRSDNADLLHIRADGVHRVGELQLAGRIYFAGRIQCRSCGLATSR